VHGRPTKRQLIVTLTPRDRWRMRKRKLRTWVDRAYDKARLVMVPRARAARWWLQGLWLRVRGWWRRLRMRVVRWWRRAWR